MRHLIVPITVLLLASASAYPSPAAQRSGEGKATLFTGARLITDGDQPPIEDSSFLVEGDRIARVGKRSDVQAPAGAQRVDLSGKTVIPALVNAHGHVGFQKDVSFEKTNYTRENIINQLKQYALLRHRGRDDRRHRCGGHQLSAPGSACSRRGAPAHGRTRVCHAQCRSWRSRHARRSIRRHDRRRRTEGRS